MDDGTVVGRALEIVNTVALGIQTPLVDLVAKTGIPKPTVRRIAEDLVRRHVLVRAPHGYAIGPGLAHLGRIAAYQHSFLDARDHLEELHAQCGGLVWLSPLDPHQAAVPLPVEVACDPELSGLVQAYWPDPTSLATLANTAGGRLVLDGRPDILDQLGRCGLPRSTPNSPMTVGELEAALWQAHDLGASVESEQSVLGWRCVAVRVRGLGQATAILGVTVPVARSDAGRILKATLRAAESLAASTQQRAGRTAVSVPNTQRGSHPAEARVTE